MLEITTIDNIYNFKITIPIDNIYIHFSNLADDTLSTSHVMHCQISFPRGSNNGLGSRIYKMLPACLTACTSLWHYYS